MQEYKTSADRKNVRDKKEPKRIEYAKKQLESMGFSGCWDEKQRCLCFMYKGSVIKFHPFAGWASGKTIKDGRGLNNLLKQLRGQHDRNITSGNHSG